MENMSVNKQVKIFLFFTVLNLMACSHLPLTTQAYVEQVHKTRQLNSYLPRNLLKTWQVGQWSLYKSNRQLNPPSQTIPFTLKAEFFQSLPRVKTDLMLLVHNVALV